MSAPVERRVEALEKREQPAQRWVWRREGETAEQAMHREGVEPGDDVLVFSWQEANL